MRLASIALVFCAVVPAAVAAPARKPAPKAVKIATKSPARSKAPRGARGKVARVPAQTWRNRQAAPTKQRYMEIQQALYEQGYLTKEPTGNWDQASANALREFQADQKLSVTGRLSSLTLINLGLGPSQPATPLSLPTALQLEAPPSR